MLPARAVGRAVAGIVPGAVLLLAAAAHATVIRVPDDYATIHEGLDAAISGDVVVVAPGVYTETITRTIPLQGGDATYTAAGFLRSGITLRSEGGASVTSIELTGANGWERGLVAGGLTTWHPAIVEGFRFRKAALGGAAILLPGLPPGITAAVALEVRSCIFDGIDGSTESGGIHATTGNLTVVGCVFRDCDSTTGGGIAHLATQGAGPAMTLFVQTCSFDSCQSSGVQTLDAHTQIRDSEFRGCLGGGGGAVRCLSPLLTVERCRFEQNAGITGTAVYWRRTSGAIPGWIRECLFLENRALFHRPGGAVALEYVTGDVVANTFLGNQGEEGGWSDSYASAARFVAASARFENNVVMNSVGAPAVQRFSGTLIEGCNVYWANAAGHVSGFTRSSTSRIVDPQLCASDSGDFTVRASSPCAPEYSNGCGLIGAFDVGCEAAPVLLTTEPPVLRLVADGDTVQAPHAPDPTLWAPGTEHTLAAPTLQDIGSDTAWVFVSWSDGGDTTHTVIVPEGPVVYSATYAGELKTLVQFTTSPVDLLLKVEGTSAQTPFERRFPAGSSVTVEATSPQPGSPGYEWRFESWSDDGERTHEYVVPPGPVASLNATFTEHALDGILFDTSPTGLKLRIDGYYITMPHFSPSWGPWAPGTQHTVQAISPQSAGPESSYVYAGWSDGGDTTHVITVPEGHAELTASYVLVPLIWVTLTSDPIGRTIVVNGVPRVAPYKPRLPLGTYFWVDAPSPQSAPPYTYYYESWSDGGAQYHVVQVPPDPLTLEARFSTEPVAAPPEEPPLRFAFETLRPNPFRRQTVLGFSLERAERARCLVYDVGGRLVATILDAVYPSGEHVVPWEGQGRSGRLPAGIYFLRLSAGEFAATRKVVLLD